MATCKCQRSRETINYFRAHQSLNYQVFVLFSVCHVDILMMISLIDAYYKLPNAVK